MTTERKLLIAFGALILVIMIAIASFSLGVYVGEQGWTARPPDLVGPGRGDPGQLQAAPPGGPGAPGAGSAIDRPPRPDLVGRLRRINSESIQVETKEGLRQVLMDAETIFLKRIGEKEQPAQKDDLRRGDYVAIFVKPGGVGLNIVARLIVILPPP